MAEVTDSKSKYETWKYGGEKFYEPWWFPESQQRRMRFKMINEGLDGAILHFAENETYSDEGAKDMLDAVTGLLRLMYIRNKKCTVVEALRYIGDSLAEVKSDSTIRH